MSSTAITAQEWRAIADLLASRLIHHAYCDEHAEVTEDCPFCDDIAAFVAYQKAGGTMRARSVSGPTIAIEHVPQNGSEGADQ